MNDDRRGAAPHPGSLWRLPLDYPIAATAVFILVASAFFLAFPGVDLAASALFYHGDGEFLLRKNPLLRLLRSTTYPIVVTVVAVLGALVAIKLARPQSPSYVPPSVTAFLLATLIAGPGIIVNTILKGYWGRPRPHEIDVFGGEATYVPVWQISDYCDSNCSFVSGETSVAVWLVAVAVVMPPAIRPAAVAVTAVYAALASFNRILFGGHFLSDVLLSAGITLLVIAAGYRLFIETPPRWLANDRLEAALGRLGAQLAGRRNRAG